jgi:hypothetical protein
MFPTACQTSPLIPHSLPLNKIAPSTRDISAQASLRVDVGLVLGLRPSNYSKQAKPTAGKQSDMAKLRFCWPRLFIADGRPEGMKDVSYVSGAFHGIGIQILSYPILSRDFGQ